MAQVSPEQPDHGGAVGCHAARDKIAHVTPEHQNPPLGINIFGYFYAESGIGEHSRQLVETVRQSGIPYVAVPYTRTLTRQQQLFEDPHLGAPRFPINIVSVNADELPHFATDVGEGFLESRYTIGLWAWEIEDFPRSMARSHRYLDEIWANSSFSAEAIQKKVDCPVYPFPLPVSVPELEAPARQELDLPEGFIFLFCFDFDSIFERKNPTAVVRAFLEAFPDDDQVYLQIKSINGSKAPEKLQLLRSATAGDPRISIVDGYWESKRVRALMASCDAYLSLHRAEGFGLTMAEAMAYGKPVVATGYSGNLDFMNDRNSYLVTPRMIEVTEGCEPYPRGALWADPDVSEAARLMRHILSTPAEAREKAALGRADIEQHHSPAARSRFVRTRIEDISSHLAQSMLSAELPGLDPGFQSELPSHVVEDVPSVAGFVGAQATGESDAIAHLSARLEEGPDLRRATGLGQPGLWLRRLIFRLLRNYHLYQLETGRSSLLVLRELDQALRESRQQLEDLGQRVTRLERQLDLRPDPDNSQKND